MADLFQIVLPVFLLLGFGYLAVWRGLFAESDVEALMRFAQNFALPCLLFRAIATLDLSQSFDWRLLISFYTGAVVAFLTLMLATRYVFGREWVDAVAIGFIGLFSNSVLLGLPITERAYGPGALAANYALISLHAPFCYTIGIVAMEIARNRGSGVGAGGLGRTILRMMVTNALMMGILLGFVSNVTGLVPTGLLLDALDMMVRAALPVALFGLGGILYRYRPEGDLRIIAVACLVSLFLHPAITWALGTATGLTTDQFRSAVLTAAMAPGINTYLFANMYGAGRRVAASSVLIATSISIVTIWIWLALLP